jgi:hypothetical protein
MTTDKQNLNPAGGMSTCSLTPQEQISRAMGALQVCDITGYILTIETKADWIAFKNPDYEWNSPSMKENRFNKVGQSAFYIASGDNT